MAEGSLSFFRSGRFGAMDFETSGRAATAKAVALSRFQSAPGTEAARRRDSLDSQNDAWTLRPPLDTLTLAGFRSAPNT
jgi:hypothetical protein